jgi:alpha 1,3-glucosidase
MRTPLPTSTSLFGLAVTKPVLSPEQQQRPFVLSRAFWAGSQRFGAIWTGDNAATWGHLKISAPMLLSISIAGLSFVGADVGGFFGEPSAELFTRWYQAGSFTPFFRGHAHHDTKRREPWVFGEPYTTILRQAAMLRYSLLPYWYTVFYEASATGMPVMRPMVTEFPDDIITFAMDNQWLVGDALLVHPVTDEEAIKAFVYLPGSNPWYDLNTLVATSPSEDPVLVDASLDKIPVFIRGGR